MAMSEDSRLSTIIEAARKRFAHFGVAKTTMNEIAHDIGMSKAALYYYFPDKDQLVVAVVDQDLEKFSAVVDTMINRPSRAAHKLKKYVSIRNAFFKELLTLAKIEQLGVADLFDPMFSHLRANLFKKEKELVAKILATGIREKEFTRASVEEHAELFVCGLIGLRSAALVINPVTPIHNIEVVDAQTRLFVDMFLKALRP